MQRENRWVGPDVSFTETNHFIDSPEHNELKSNKKFTGKKARKIQKLNIFSIEWALLMQIYSDAIYSKYVNFFVISFFE